jgi:hypothetical protein
MFFLDLGNHASSIVTAFTRLKYDIRAQFGNSSIIFFPLNSLTKGRKYAVTKNTDFVIEGFERSANSFSVRAFREAQVQPYSIAHHLHVPAQILFAIKHEIPVLVLIRNPVDAVLSWKSLELETKNKLSISKDLTLVQLFKQYNNFYSTISPYRNKYVIGLFEEVTKDFGQIINRVNKRYGTSFALFDHSNNNVESVIRQGSFHVGSTNMREELKKIVTKRYEIEIQSTKLQSLVKISNEIYHQFKYFAYDT